MGSSTALSLGSLNQTSQFLYPCPQCYSNWKSNSSSLFSSYGNNKRSLTCFSSNKKIGFMDQILDYIEGGPKLRKWYGAPDLLPKDGSLSEENESSEEDEVRDAVLVTDGDNEIGQMVILSLIIKRTRIKAMVKDKRAAMEAFGDARDRSMLKKALRGVRAVICPNLSVYRGSSGVQAIVTANARKQAEQDESLVMASGIPYTIIRTGLLVNAPGGNQGFNFKEGCASQGKLSKEDAAFICVEALDTLPQKGLIVEVVNGEEKVMDWKVCFATLIERSVL
ncbi:putative developmentally regulated G-protein 2-like isoform X1 [Capsicum annuum]|nr:putative developmentally regulated G-protein 2-like isoform X1 [Capsicum annuum]